MNKTKNNKKVSAIFRYYNSMIAFIVGFIFVVTFSIFQIQNFNKNAEISKQRYLESNKRTVKDEVLKILNFIYLTRSSLEEKMETDIKNRVDQAWSINKNIYEKYKDILGKEEIKIIIKNALRPVRFFNNRGYYFIVSMNGVEELFPPSPELEGVNLLGLQDMKGNFVIQDEINVIKEKAEGFITDYWRKPGDNEGMIYPKTSYVKYFEPLDWYIGTGEYLDNIEKELQEEVIKRVKEITFKESGYIYINTYDNKAVVINSVKYKAGDDLTGLTDANGIDIIATQKELALQPDGGFSEYYWEKPGTSILSPKISYVKGIDEWQWIIGGGIYTDEIDHLIKEERKVLYQQLGIQVITAILIFIIVFIFVLLIANRISKKIRDNFEIFSEKLKDAVWSGKLLKPDDYNIKDIETFSDNINNIIKSKQNAENLLIESETRLRSILEHAPVMIALFDGNLNYLDANKEVVKYFDFKISKERAITIHQLITANNLDENILDKFTKMDGSFHQLELNTKQGIKTQNWALLKTETNEIIAVGYDITEIKENQKRLKELNETKDKFFSIISHDLIGPFNTIVGLSDLLINDFESYDDSKKKKIINQIFNSSTSMYKMLVNLLNWATTQTGGIDYNPIDFKLKEIADEVLNILTPQAFEKSIIIKNKIKNNIQVFSDPLMTKTVVQNIVANSVKFTKPNGLIEIDSTEMHNEVLVSIKDNGIGIKKDIIETIFTINKEKKQRGTANESGTGLGLVICKEFVEKMGGKIWVESELGKGTTFFFTLCKEKK